jgi:hypothetical protein
VRNLKDRPEHLYTLEDYFALERASERHYKFWDGEIVCMSGGTLAHGQIIRNVFRGIDRGLTGGPCQAFTGDMAVKTPLNVPELRMAAIIPQHAGAASVVSHNCLYISFGGTGRLRCRSSVTMNEG